MADRAQPLAARRALQPFALTERVRLAYRRYLKSRHKLADPDLQRRLEALVDSGTIDAKGPYIALARERLAGRSLPELARDGVILPETATLNWGMADRALYLHQDKAIQQLAEGKNTVVTTSTGSGKTEAFLIPLIDGLIRARRQEGPPKSVRAIILYPMNALANDQRDRIAAILRGFYAVHGLRFALFIGTLPETATEGEAVDPATGECRERREVRREAPDLLLSNYTMLELMLIRERERDLFGPDLRFLVLDEVHTYRGALGTEIACLVRRLRAHAGLEPGRLVCAATSATVKDEDGPAAVARFATDLFGETFLEEHVRGEEPAPPPPQTEPYVPPFCQLTREELAALRGAGVTDAQLVHLAERLCGRPAPPGPDEPAEIRSLFADNALVRWLEEQVWERPRLLEELSRDLCETNMRRGQEPQSVELELEGYLLAGATAHIDDQGRVLSPPALRPQIHMFFHGIENLTVCMNCRALLTDGQQRHAACEPDGLALPLAACNTCGEDSVRVTAVETSTGDSLMTVVRRAAGVPAVGYGRARQGPAPPEGLYIRVTGDTTPHRTGIDDALLSFRAFEPDQVLDEDDEGNFAEEEPPAADPEAGTETAGPAPDGGGEAATAVVEEAEVAQPHQQDDHASRFRRNRVIESWLCIRCGIIHLQPPDEERCGIEGCEGPVKNGSLITPVGIRIPRRRRENPGITKCPWCGDWNTQGRDIVAPWWTVTAPGVTVLTEETLDELADQELKRRSLVFSDNRQDAAHQAGYINDQHRQNMIRRVLYSILRRRAEEGLGPSTIAGDLVDAIFNEMKRLGLITRADGAAVKPHQQLGGGELPRWRRAIEAMLLDEFCRGGSRRQTLETLGLVEVCYPLNLEDLQQAQGFQELCEMVERPPEEVVLLLRGLLDIFRRGRSLTWTWFVADPRGPSNPDHLIFMDLTSSENRLRYGYVARRFSTRPSGYKLTGERFRDGVFVNPLVSSRGAQTTWVTYLRRLGIATDLRSVTDLTLTVLGDAGFLDEIGLVDYQGRQAARGLMLRWDLVQLRAGDDLSLYRCDSCRRVWSVALTGSSGGPVCFKRSCNGRLRRLNPEADDYTVGQVCEEEPRPLTVAEHSAQVPPEVREDIEREFKGGGDTVHGIVCTPTMELGVDIGDLATVILRNVPPSPANYAQRGGRAGRRLRTSAILTFCGPGSHDRYFFDRPEDMIAGRIRAPRFRIDNPVIVERHARSYILEKLGNPLPLNLGDLMPDPAASAERQMPANTIAEVHARRRELSTLVYSLFAADGPALPWWNHDEATRILTAFPVDLQGVLSKWGSLVQRIRSEHDQLSQTIGARGEDPQLTRLRQLYRDWTQQTGQAGPPGEMSPAYTLTFLRDRGFLPSYMFPVDPCTLHIASRDTQSMGEYRIGREAEVALTEFAPGNIVYAFGAKYRVSGLHIRAAGTNLRNTDWLRPVQVHLDDPECGFAQFIDENSPAKQFCPYDSDALTPEIQIVEARNFTAEPVERITADEAVRLRSGFSIRHFLVTGDAKGDFYPYPFLPMLVLRQAPLLFLNLGRRGGSGNGFRICTECGWSPRESLEMNGEDIQEELRRAHSRERPRCQGEVSASGTPLGYRFRSDAVIIEAAPPGLEEWVGGDYLVTLKNALMVGAQAHLEVGGDEIDGFQRVLGSGPAARHQILLYDAVPGGAGYLQELATELPSVAARAYDILFGHQCTAACYACLLDYRNQIEHPLLDKELVRDHLLLLSLAEPLAPQEGGEALLANALLEHTESRAEEIGRMVTRTVEGGINVAPAPDQRTWQEALKRAESPIESLLLQALRDLGAKPPVAQLNIFDSDGQFICCPDFVYPEERLAVFCDGAMYHLVRERALADYYQRRKLTIDQWDYLPFWGVEITRDATACARVILACFHRHRPDGLRHLGQSSLPR